jgi:beta-xylosidase
LPSPFGREAFLAKVSWIDDWPLVNNGQKLQLSFEAPQNPASISQSWRDDFDQEELAVGWYNKSERSQIPLLAPSLLTSADTPLKREWSLHERPGWLRLHGGPYDLQSLESPTMLVRKQSIRDGTWTTRLDFNPSKPTYEAGMVLYWNLYTFASIGVRRAASGAGREIRFTHPDGRTGSFKHSAHPLHYDGPVTLVISCASTHYKLGYIASAPASEMTWLEPIPMQVMTADPPRGMAFTGMMTGVYAFGEREPCLSPADFEFVNWGA